MVEKLSDGRPTEARLWAATILAAATFAGGFSYDSNSHISRVEAQLVGHVDTHPDTNLRAEIVRLRYIIDRMDERQRDMLAEIGELKAKLALFGRVDE